MTDPKEMSKNDLVREVKRLRHLLAQQMEAAPGVAPSISVVGIVRSTDREPAVQMRAGEAAWEMTLAEAREHAADTLAAAVEAERDAATIAFLFSTGMDEQEAGGFLLALRDHRVRWMADNAVVDGDPR